MAYEATPAAARWIAAVRGSEAVRAAWRVAWTTRAAVLVVAVFAALSFGPATGGLARENAARFDEPALTRPIAEPLLAPLARWDAVWYLRIADSGYGDSAPRAAFFPLYPLLIRSLAAPVGGSQAALLIASYLISLAAFLAAINLMLFASLVFALIACVGVFRRLPRAYGAWVAVALVLPLSFPVGPQPLMSLPRFLAVLFPIFMWLAVVTEERRITPQTAAASAVGLGLFSAQFATWHWIS